MATITADRLGSTPSSPAYGNDVAALEALAGTGIPERTGENAWAMRPTTDFQNSVMQWGGTDTGAVNAYVFALSPVLTAYATGAVYGGKIGTSHTNTGACTANFGPGAKSIKMPDGSDPAAGVFTAGQVHRFVYDGTNLVPLNASVWNGVSAAEVTVTSAATCDILGAASALVAITGSTGPITSFGTGTNRLRFVRVITGGQVLTHNGTTLFLPANGGNITLAAGDTFIVKSDASSNTRVIAYQRASGQPVVSTSTFTGDSGSGGAVGLVPAPAAGDAAAGKVLGAGGGFVLKGAAPDIILEDQKSSGTDGGTFTSGADRTRDLNTEVRDSNSYCTLSSNQFTLVAGTWYIEAEAPAYGADEHQIILRDVTGAADLKRGTSAKSRYNGGTSLSAATVSSLTHVFTNASSNVYEIRHRGVTTNNTVGFGDASGLGVETYTRVKLWKVG